VRVVGRDSVIVGRHASLPPVCLKCAAREPVPIVRIKRAFAVVPWYGRLLSLTGLRIVKPSAALELPICEACAARARRAELLTTFVTSCFAAIGAAATGFALALGGKSAAPTSAIAIASCLAIPILFHLAFARRRSLPRARHVDDTSVTLARVAPGAIDSILYAAAAATQGFGPYGVGYAAYADGAPAVP
jgi:hypothetical protein